MRNVQNWFTLLLLACVFGPVEPVGGTVLDLVTERQLVKEAEFIFRGVVTKVEYRVSDLGNQDDVQLPHTFVTYQIEEILKGSVRDQSTTLTLRFQGGQDMQRQRFLAIDGCPLLDVGDGDVLFVRGNGKHVCPLMGWQQGRFRVIGENEVFTDNGREVWLTTQETLASGPLHLLEEVLTHKGGGTRLRRQVRSDEEAEEPAQPDPIQGSRLSATDFIEFIAGIVATLHTPEELKNLPPVESADPNVPFFVRELKPLPPPEEITDHIPSFTGKAHGIGMGKNTAGVAIVGIFTSTEAIDLSAPGGKVMITSLFNEVGGAGEVVADLPLTLFADPRNNANVATFKTAVGVLPIAKVTIGAKGGGKFTFRVDVAKATIVPPSLCPTTNLHFTIDGVNPPVAVTTTQPWRCFGAGNKYLKSPPP